MIKGIIIVNNSGKPRLVKFYQNVLGEEKQQSVIRRVFQQVSTRPDSFCNYLEGSVPEWGEKCKLIYRHYATLYFVFAVDAQESDLGILDLIQGERCACDMTGTLQYFGLLPNTTRHLSKSSWRLWTNALRMFAN